MSPDFFASACQEAPRDDQRFGLCDDRPGQAAYSDIGHTELWIAIVINEQRIQVGFTAIDHCVEAFKANGVDRESLCDGMLTFDDALFFVELKDRKKNWLSSAMAQLESTIKILS
jgi:hypothetical protein